VFKDFDESQAKSWGSIDLNSVLAKQNKKNKVVQAKPTTVIIQKASESRIRPNINLKLTETVTFSITHFEKLNKGFLNASKVNCFMNVCLQSLFACPGFYNLMQAISASDLMLDQQGTVIKLV
jgi:hypothetical protein